MKNGNKKQTLKNTVAFKRGTVATLLTVVFIVAIVLVNILVTALCQRFPISLDLTSDKVNTMSSENIDFIKTVDKEVDMYVLLTEEQYVGGYMSYYAQNLYGVASDDPNASKYYSQTVEFLKDYGNYNDKINVQFIDPSDPSNNDLMTEYSTFTVGYGDVLLRCKTVDSQGKEVVRKEVVNYTDIYSLEDTYGMAQYYGTGYYISGNNVEAKVSSALNKVTADSTPVFLVLDKYSDINYLSQLETVLTNNNYEIEHLKGFVEELSPEKYAGIILCAPTGDLTIAELEVIDNFLYNDLKREKSFFFYANHDTIKYPNLCEFLSEWGITFDSGTLYSTSKNYYYQQNTQMFLASLENEFTEPTDAKGLTYVSNNIIPMNKRFDKADKRISQVILQTSKNTIVKPIDAGVNWAPSEDAKGSAYPAAIVTYEESVYNNEKLSTSHVVAFASADFISNSLVNNNSVGNLNYTVDIFNKVTGQDDTYTFVAKTITNESYQDQISETSVLAIRIIFMAVVPIILVIVGVIVWIRRKNR